MQIAASSFCVTSNPSAGDFQDLVVDGRPLYQHVAARVASEWNDSGQCSLVVGATWPAQLREVRDIVGDSVPLLVPGVGAQGGKASDVVENAATSDGFGLMINSSRGIIYASNGRDFADKARIEALKLQEEMAEIIK